MSGEKTTQWEEVNVAKPDMKKNPLISLVLSLFIPGAGQFYNGLHLKAAAIFFMFLISLVTIICPFFIWLYAMFDAYIGAIMINRGIALRDWAPGDNDFDIG